MPIQPFGQADPQYDALRVFSQQALDVGSGSGIDEGAAVWSKILVMRDTDNTTTVFDFSVAGLLAALAFADSGDVIWCGPGTLTTDITLPDGVSIVGMAGYFNLIGTVTCAGSGGLEAVGITPSGNSASRISAVISATSGNLVLNNCNLFATNAGAGGAAGLSTQSGGTVNGWNCNFRASGTSSYGVNASAGTFYDHGQCVYSGTTDRFIGNVSTYSFDNDIKLLDSAGALVKVFTADSVGIAAAIAAATSGDVIACPSHIAIALTSGVTIGAGVTLKNANLSFSGFAGTGVTMSAGAALKDFVINYNGAGQASARGILASGVLCHLSNGDSYASGATTNTAIELSGQDENNKATAVNVYGEASGGTTAIGMRLLDWVNVNTSYGVGNGAATTNVGIRFAATAAANTGWCAHTWGYSVTTGSVGMEVEASKYGRIIGGFAVGVLAGLLIGTGATAMVYGLQWSSLSNSGTITLLPGSGVTSTGSVLGWLNVEDYGAVHNGSTDDTAAIQAAIDAAAARGGATIYFPGGTYIIGGALQDGARGNAQLLLPAVHTDSGDQFGITFLGESVPSPIPWLSGAQPVQYGVVIKGTLNSGAGGALLGGWGPSGSYDDFSLITVKIENMIFEMPSNPVLSALNLGKIGDVDLNNVFVVAGDDYDFTAVAQPTTATSYGVVLPKTNNGATVHVGTLGVMGFYNGVEMSEHATAEVLNVYACKYAARLPQTGHALTIQRMLVEWSQNGIKIDGAAHLSIEMLNLEHYNPATYGAKWFEPVYDIDDASNYGIGRITWHATLSGTGADDPIVTNGGANLHISSIHDAGGGGSSGKYRQFLYSASGGNLTILTDTTGNPLWGLLDLE